MSEAAKVRDMPEVMKYITGLVADVGCGTDKITWDAIGYDGRQLPGVDFNTPMCWLQPMFVDTVFSSHFLEHIPSPFDYIMNWHENLKLGGHIVVYLPDGRYYNNHENMEHLVDMNYDQFLFWFRRVFCGEGKDFRGNNLPKLFELVLHKLDVGDDRYSFVIVARKI
jgi:trans-aconitate methyltransferase